MSDTDVVSQVESSLFNRMLRNAFAGFFKSAVLALAIGGAIGAIAFGAGLLPATLIPAAITGAFGSSAAVAGAITVGAALMVPAGAFGAVAGIQSTRDARRYFNADEVSRDSLIPNSQDKPKLLVEPILEERIHAENQGEHRERPAERQRSYDPSARGAP